jgi:UTP:GlnB (protein PII) uridylyltransferase
MPLQVTIDNESYDDRTVVTVDSANRPGTLVEVVQCLTELGLNVKRARISSDGGWFVDEFHVTEANDSSAAMHQACARVKICCAPGYRQLP